MRDGGGVNFTGYDDAMLTSLYADLLIEQADLNGRLREVNHTIAAAREERLKRSQVGGSEDDGA